MNKNLNYTNPLDIASLFRTKDDLIEFFSYLIKRTHALSQCSDHHETYVSPIIYVRTACVYSVDYNYLIASIAEWSGIDQIVLDYGIRDYDNDINNARGLFLIKGVFEYIYELIWLSDKVDTSKYSGKIVKIKPRFFNLIVFKQGNVSALLYSVPFLENSLRSLLPWDVYATLLLFEKIRYEQTAFGEYAVSRLGSNILRDLKRF